MRRSLRHSAGQCTCAPANPSGTGLVYSTYFGGNDAGGNPDYANAIAVDGSGNTYITGESGPKDITVTQTAYPGGFDTAWAAKLDLPPLGSGG
jgi:hypothetical protein